MDYFQLAGDLIRQKAEELKMENETGKTAVNNVQAKTPWEIIGRRDGLVVIRSVTINADGSVYSMPVANTFCEANAEFIVKAVNAHDALVEALKGCIARLEEDGIEETHINHPLALARAALAKAKGE